jgi:ribosomal protein L33
MRPATKYTGVETLRARYAELRSLRESVQRLESVRYDAAERPTIVRRHEFANGRRTGYTSVETLRARYAELRNLREYVQRLESARYDAAERPTMVRRYEFANGRRTGSAFRYSGRC